MRYVKNTNLLLIIIIYIFITIKLIIENSVFYINVVNPIFWSAILVYIICDIKKGYIRISKNNLYYIYMIIISILQIIVTFYIGFFKGFVKSPYNRDIISILKNIFIQAIPIVGIEFTRALITNRNKDNKVLIAFVTLILILLEIKYNVFVNLYSNKKLFFEYNCSIILPLIACNILYTYLTLKVSFLLPLIHRIFSVVYVSLSPIFPDVDWFILGTINILSDILIYILFKYKYTIMQKKKSKNRNRQNTHNKVSYVVTLTFCITLVCFMLGVFKYEPITILSNSMFPSFCRGDVVIYRKISNDELRNIHVGSIIIYNIKEQNIAHRVVDIVKENGTILYKTKGDYNNVSDTNLVRIEQIKGICEFHIKYIGYPSVWLHDYFNSENAKVEIK